MPQLLDKSKSLFERLRNEYDAGLSTIDDFATNEEIFSSDQVDFHEQFKAQDAANLPKYLLSSDHIEDYSGNRINHRTGAEYINELQKCHLALNRRYIRTFRKFDHKTLTRFIAIDVDIEFSQNAWIGKLPSPYWTIIDPFSKKCHFVWVLDKFYEFNDTFRVILNEAMRRLDGDCMPHSFKSPYFKIGKRKRTEEFRGTRRRSADYFFVIHHRQAPISFAEFSKFISDTREAEETTKSASQMKLVNAIASPKNHGRNCHIFDETRLAAYELGRKLNKVPSYEEINNLAERFNTDGLPKHEIRSISKSIHRYMEANFDITKCSRRLSSDEARFAIEVRWNNYMKVNGELLVDAARRFNISYRTAKRWKSEGKLVKLNKKWVIDENPSRTLMEKVGLIDVNRNYTNESMEVSDSICQSSDIGMGSSDENKPYARKLRSDKRWSSEAERLKAYRSKKKSDNALDVNETLKPQESSKSISTRELLQIQGSLSVVNSEAQNDNEFEFLRSIPLRQPPPAPDGNQNCLPKTQSIDWQRMSPKKLLEYLKAA